MNKEKRKFIKLIKNVFKLAPHLSIPQALLELEIVKSTTIEGNGASIITYNKNDEETISKAKTAYKKFFKRQFKGCSITSFKEANQEEG